MMPKIVPDDVITNMECVIYIKIQTTRIVEEKNGNIDANVIPDGDPVSGNLI